MKLLLVHPLTVVRVVRVVRVNIQKLVLGSPSLVPQARTPEEARKKFLISTLTTLTTLTTFARHSVVDDFPPVT